MSGNADADLREEVRSRYAAAARAVMEPKSGASDAPGAPAGCCDGTQASSCCGTEPDSDPADVFRVLVPGGRIGISDVVAEDRLTPADRAAAGSYVGCIAGALSRAEYLAGLAAAGFADASVTFTTEAASGIHWRSSAPSNPPAPDLGSRPVGWWPGAHAVPPQWHYLHIGRMTGSLMETDGPEGVVFPASADGRRSTSALGRAVIADALRPVDPAGALGAEQETNWRSGYLGHFRRLVEAGLASKAAALSIARDGLDSLHNRMRVRGPGDAETELDALLSAPAVASFGTLSVPGVGQRETELSLPYHGERLRGDALARQLDTWVSGGIIEPSCAEALREVAAHPEWLRLPGQTVIALGAGAEVGPLEVLLRWGARVAAVDLPSPPVWERVLHLARQGAGELLVPVTPKAPVPPQPDSGDEAIARWAGVNLVREVPDAADWLAGLDGPLVLGNYVYADGAANVAVSAAVDALTLRLQAGGGDMALAFLATPTDVFAVPPDAVAYSVRGYAARSRTAKLAGRPLRAVSRGGLLRRAYMPGADPGICDSLVPQQGPNYALAKRLQRWRAAVAREAGTTVSINVAPPTRTRSVTKNRTLAAAYAGAHRFGVEVFEPASTRVLMAALLVHDLQAGGPVHVHPWQDEAHDAAHGGLWRIAYAPRSALGLAALLGYAAARP